MEITGSCRIRENVVACCGGGGLTAGLALGVLGLFGGMMVLAPYLVLASYQAGDDVAVLLLGKARAGRRG